MVKKWIALVCLALCLGCLNGCTVVPAAPGTAQTTTLATTTVPSVPVTEPVTQPSTPSVTEPTEPAEPEPAEPVLPAPDPNVPYTSATHAFVYDCGSDSYLYLKGELDKGLYTASVAKLLTALVVLDHLDPGIKIRIGNELFLMDPDSSCSNLYIGETLTVENLLRCMLLPSGNDAAYALAAATGRSLLNDPNATPRAAVDAFVAELNRKAGELGMENSHFSTPDGSYRTDQRISIADHVLLAQACLAQPLLLEITSTYFVIGSYWDRDGRKLDKWIVNRNELLNPNNAYGRYRENCVGLKTGSGSKSGDCLLGAYLVEGRYILVGVFGCAEEGRFRDANRLYDYFFPKNR